MDIKQSKAIISGGASGLGFATAENIINKGGKVVLLDINKDGEKSAKSLGNSATYILVDISVEDEVKAAIEEANNFLDGINLAVNCAGVIGAARALGRDGPMDANFFERTIKINLIGSFTLAKESANIMQNNKPNNDGERGVIVNTASVAAYEGQIGQAAYSSSKAGIVGMTLPLAREFARIGIRVNTIAPGIFKTPMVSGMTETLQESLGKQVPFPPRLGNPDEFADLVESIYRNAMINGETIRLDGAIRMQPK
jgi:NAD(P)-dependent dehydrogenase (short-subunit alcohol dehydrogenase family)